MEMPTIDFLYECTSGRLCLCDKTGLGGLCDTLAEQRAPHTRVTVSTGRSGPTARRKGTVVCAGGQRSAGGHTNRCFVFDLGAGDRIGVVPK